MYGTHAQNPNLMRAYHRRPIRRWLLDPCSRRRRSSAAPVPHSLPPGPTLDPMMASGISGDPPATSPCISSRCSMLCSHSSLVTIISGSGGDSMAGGAVLPSSMGGGCTAPGSGCHSGGGGGGRGRPRRFALEKRIEVCRSRGTMRGARSNHQPLRPGGKESRVRKPAGRTGVRAGFYRTMRAGMHSNQGRSVHAWGHAHARMRAGTCRSEVRDVRFERGGCMGSGCCPGCGWWGPKGVHECNAACKGGA